MLAKYFLKWLSCFLICYLPFSFKAQGLININARIDSIEHALNDDKVDSDTKSNLADSAFHLLANEGDACKQIFFRVKQATFLDNIGRPDSALTQLYWAQEKFSSSCDSAILLHLYANLTNVFLSLGELDKVDSVAKMVLSSENAEWKQNEYRFAIITNLAITQANRGDMDRAGNYFRQVYNESLSKNNVKYIQISLNNLGSLKGALGDLDSAYFFFNQALTYAKRNQDMDNYLSIIINLANLDGEMGRYDRAIIKLDSAYHLATSLHSSEKIANVQRARAEVFALSKNFKKAYEYLGEFITIREQFLNEERINAVTEMMEKYESEKKARQIQQLEIEKLDAKLENQKITNARNRFLFIGIAVLVIAFALLSRLRYVQKARAAIQKEKDVSENLLLNILPNEVAQELKQKGYAEAKHFDPVTILFSDFKGFTTVSEELTAAELVEELNACFKTFDDIMTKYGIEKIKTIGDAYMAAGSLPDTNSSTAGDVVKAGLEMQDFVTNRKNERDALHLPSFEMRVGIHSGPVVAGIVGVKKFQYDLWGDTVNIASRMESNSEVGKVNISEATFQLVRDNPGFSCKPRGKINVKGKGELEMYFVEKQVNRRTGEQVSGRTG